MKPAVAEPPAGTEPFHAALLMVLAPERVPFHACESVAPDTVVFQPLSADDPAVTVTSPTNPPRQLWATCTVALRGPGPPVAVGVGVGVGVGVDVTVGVGVGVDVTVGVGVGVGVVLPPPMLMSLHK